jgi:hypothetical protein
MCILTAKAMIIAKATPVITNKNDFLFIAQVKGAKLTKIRHVSLI